MTYTTGDVAAICKISVRTVQYYDTRGVVSPSFFSEGGRRLYTEDDLSRMKLVCYLRELEMPLGTIAELLQEDHSEDVITLILAEHEKQLLSEIDAKRRVLSMLQELKSILKTAERVTPEAIGSVASMMEKRNELKKVRRTMLLSALPVLILEIVGIILWIQNGIWWPMAVYGALMIPYGIWISLYYVKRVDYVCPSCNHVFHPKFKETFWANHTMKTRKLKCPSCHRKGFCVEIYHGEEYDGKADSGN